MGPTPHYEKASYRDIGSPVPEGWDLAARTRQWAAAAIRRRARALVMVLVVSLLAAFAGAADARSAEADRSDRPGLNKVALPDFDPATWRPTAETPLPTMASPVVFRTKDDASYWFDTELKDLEPILKTRSLAVGSGPTTIKVLMEPPDVETAHTFTSIVWPEGAVNMPFITPGPALGEFSVDLVTPGLYAWNCTIHPYMAAAAVIDDPATPGADFGKRLRWIDRKILPSAAHEVLHVVKSFFTLTGPLNWQVHAPDGDVAYDPGYPPAPVLTYNEDGSPNFIPNLDAYYQEKYREGSQVLQAPVPPEEPGVGTLYVDTQWERSKGKTKPGSITAWDTETWQMKSKWFGASVDLNNPHNQWTNADGSRMFVTNWYGSALATLDTRDGKVLNELEIGPSPSHVVTRTSNGNIIVPNNGGGRISEVSPDGTKVLKTYLTQRPGEKPALPHGHWVSGNGKYVITPNANDETGSIFDLDVPSMVKPHSGEHPVAGTFTNDSKRAYVSNLLSHDVVCYSTEEPACPDGKGGKARTSRIDLIQNYNRITGEATGPYAIAPIQLPVSPDDQYMLIVGTFTSNVLVIDMETHKIVKSLPCAPGCHGINFGLKKGGGWYGYVSIKYANRVMVINGDPNNDGDPSDAEIAGNLYAGALPGIQTDDEPARDYTDGQGGNGVFVYPVAYQGWVQTMPAAWKDRMTCKQREPLSVSLC
jgi:hypothetical protein